MAEFLLSPANIYQRRESMESCLIPYHASEPPVGQRVLVLAPHPDDEVFGAGGTLGLLAQRECFVKVIVLTDGALGCPRPIPDLASIREHESRSAGQLLGVSEFEFWSFPDRGLEYGEQLISRLSSAFLDGAFDTILCPALSEIHPDHHALAMATVEALRRCSVQFTLMMYEVGSAIPDPDLLVDISETLDLKLQAMRTFSSQTTHQNYVEQISALNIYRTYTLPKSVRAAEAFRVWRSGDYDRPWRRLYDTSCVARRHRGLPVFPDVDLALVSILVRSMGRKYLDRALRSIDLQTYPNIEIVVVNALGPDHPEIASTRARFPLRVVTKENTAPGQSLHLDRAEAANLALDSASGDWLLFLDDDDSIDPDHIHKLVTASRNAPERRAFHTGIACLDEQGVETGVIFDHTVDRVVLAAGNQLPIHAVLFSRALVALGCRFDESLNTYEDWDFWIQVSQYTEFGHVPGISGYYHLVGNSGVHEHDQISDPLQELVLRKWTGRRSPAFDIETARWIREAHTFQQETHHKLSELGSMHEEKRRISEELHSLKDDIVGGKWISSEVFASLNSQIKSINDVAEHFALALRTSESARSDLKKTVASLEADIALMKHNLAIAENGLADIKASRSWRITAWLRKLVLWFRKIRG